MKSSEIENEKTRIKDTLIIRNRCPVSKDCGGCSFAGRTYFEQAVAKEKRVSNLLSDHCEVLPIFYCDQPLYYRNKVHSQFKRLRNGHVIVGPYEAHSHKIIEVESCLIENRTASSIIRDCAKLAERLKVEIFDEVKRTGD